MTDEQKAAYVFAQAVNALVRIEGMKAANAFRAIREDQPAYWEQEFYDLEKEFCIGHNDVISLFHS